MADEADIANDMIEQNINSQIDKLLKKKTQQPTGFCYYCKDQTNLVFCDKGCESDYLLEQKIRKQNGNW